MRHRYRHLDPELLRSLLAGIDLMRIWNHLLLAAGGDPEEAMEWMRQLQARGYLAPDLDLDAFFAELERERLIGRDGDGTLVLTGAGERRIRRSALEAIFTGLHKGDAGYHPTPGAGEGSEPLPETRPWSFGDEPHHIDGPRSLANAMRRTAGELELAEEDLEVFETEHLTSCATVIAIDVSHSMILYGEDRITPAKTVALALTELIRTRYPKDFVEVIRFGDRAERIPDRELAFLEAGPFHTNTREALQLGRAILERRRQPNRQIFLITDGKPSAITEGGRIYKNPMGLDLKIVNRTLEEADQCRRQRIVITTFMLATDPTLQDFVEKMTRLNRGRAYFASPDQLGEFIFADYLRNRRRRVH